MIHIDIFSNLIVKLNVAYRKWSLSCWLKMSSQYCHFTFPYTQFRYAKCDINLLQFLKNIIYCFTYCLPTVQFPLENPRIPPGWEPLVYNAHLNTHLKKLTKFFNIISTPYFTSCMLSTCFIFLFNLCSFIFDIHVTLEGSFFWNKLCHCHSCHLTGVDVWICSCVCVCRCVYGCVCVGVCVIGFV